MVLPIRVEELKKMIEEEKREIDTLIEQTYEFLKENKGQAFTPLEILREMGREDLIPKSIIGVDLLYMLFERLKRKFPSIKNITYKDKIYYYFEEE